MQPTPFPGPFRCVAGTVLPTARGPRMAGDLAIGDVLTGRDGARHTLRWAGRMVLSRAWVVPRPALWPVRIAAGALGEGAPPAPLVLLPGTPLALPGCAPVAAEWVAIGSGITRPEPAEALDIVELHLDPPGDPGLPGLLGAPVAAPDAAALGAARAYLAARVSAGPLLGRLDAVTANEARGWATDSSGGPVAVELVVDGVARPPLAAARLRPDLADAGIAEGRAGFHLPIEPALDPARAHLVSVRRASDGADLAGSPALVEPRRPAEALVGLAPDDMVRGAVEQAVRSLAGRLAS